LEEELNEIVSAVTLFGQSEEVDVLTGASMKGSSKIFRLSVHLVNMILCGITVTSNIILNISKLVII